MSKKKDRSTISIQASNVIYSSSLFHLTVAGCLLIALLVLIIEIKYTNHDEIIEICWIIRIGSLAKNMTSHRLQKHSEKKNKGKQITHS